jgi:hypothetical protein
MLYTPVYADGLFSGTYTSEQVAESYIEPLYHSTALLLDDGRVWMAVGNPNRALCRTIQLG